MAFGLKAQDPPGEATNLGVALSLAARGLSVFPVHAGGPKVKQPMPFFRWRDQSSTDERAIRDWWRRWPDAAPAIDLGKSGLFVVDADRHDVENDGVAAWAKIMAQEGASPDGIPLVATPNDGNHWIFRQDGSLGNGKGRLPQGIDVRGTGGYVVAPGAIMADGRSYEVHGDPAAAPPVPTWLTKWLMKEGRAEQPTTNVVPLRSESRGAELNEVADLLGHIPPDCGYDEWVQALMAVHAATGGSSAGLSLADQWSAGGSKYKRGEVARKWASFRNQGINGATLAALARQYGADLSAIRVQHMDRDEGPGTAEHGRQVAAALSVRRLFEQNDGTITDEDGVIIDPPSAPALTPANAVAFPAGLVGAIAQWICETSRRPQPSLALGAALAIVGTAAGRQFVGPTGSGVHLYVLGLAPTGQGKDHAVQQISRILRAANLGQHIGPSEFISMPAVINFLLRSPLSLCPMDEFGDFMARILHKKASSFERSVAKILRSMWGISFGEYQSPEWAGRQAATIFAPAMSIYGVSTPEQFWRALEGAAVEDGTVNRFLLVGGDTKSQDRDPGVSAQDVPSQIVSALRALYEASGPMAYAMRNQSDMDPAQNRRQVGWDHGAEEVFAALKAEIEPLLEDPDAGAFYARTVEMSVRIATIVALGRGGPLAAVSQEDMAFGVETAKASARAMMAGAEDYLSNSEHQSNAQRIKRIIKGKGGRVKRSALMRSMQHSVRARDLNDLLKAMEEAEEIVSEKIVPSGGGTAVQWYCLAG
ncbi:bifunctional DNA primase/polymerase [Aureimonas sp. N4]|uniref:bifunctional DNA primase/polymerase n=1 Tax=Aureimonas sp. N4 TaxID=1638165 RepID=UPI0009E92006|nr:bifunctional DNA primase/polymerase [Aureimonas sp. N4]